MVTEGLRFLLEHGFSRVGTWQLVGGVAAFVGCAPREPSVYASPSTAKFYTLGPPKKGAQHRMRSYGRNQQRSDLLRLKRPIHRAIAQILGATTDIEVLSIVPEASTWNGLPINTIAGLEEGLIQMLRPRWNRKGLGAGAGKVAVVLNVVSQTSEQADR